MTVQESFDASSPLHKLNLLAQSVRARSGDSLALDPLYIPALITSMQTPGADGGLNHHALENHDSGLLVLILQYNNMRAGDWIEIFWGNGVSVASDAVLPEHVGANFPLFIEADNVPEGLHEVYYVVTRVGSDNKERSAPLNILVRRDLPGGTDPNPITEPNERLLPPQPQLPPGGVIDEEAARNGIKVIIPAYVNMREYDLITLSWGGTTVSREVAPGAVGQAVEIMVPEAVILEAGDSPALLLAYRVMDEVHNDSDGWSMPEYVDVDVDKSRPGAPYIVNPDDDADPYDLIDLDVLGDSDLTVNVMILPGQGIAKGDSVVLEWTGTTFQGQEIVFRSEPKSLPQVPWSLAFEVPNADVRGLGRGRGMASYTVSLADGTEKVSRRAFVSFTGVEQKLPRPTVREAAGGSLDPALPQATVVVPGEVLEAGDWVVMTWLGIQASGSPVLYTDQRQVSSGSAGNPLPFPVAANYIKPLDGGRLEVYYEINRAGLDTPLVSEREHLQVGEAQSALPAPGVSPAASDGWLDPDNLPDGVSVVIAPYANMRAGQTVYMDWRATVGGNAFDSMPIISFSVGKPVVFPILLKQLQENAEGDVEVWYRVEEPGQPTRRSESLHLKIGKEQEEGEPLPAPVVLEAVDGKLDPVWVPNGATVQVAYAGMLPSDILAISVLGNGPEGSFESEQKNGHEAGFVEFTVPASVIAANDGHQIRVVCARVRNGVPELSPPLVISVQEVLPEGLPTPVIPQVVEGQLDLVDFNGDAQVTVEPWPEIAVGQRYWLRAHGTKKDGTDYTITLAEGATITAAQVSAGLDIFLPRKDLLLLLNYSELRVTLRVALHGPVEEENATRFPELTITARVEHNLRREAFAGVPTTLIKYPNSLDISSMKISPVLANDSDIQLARFGAVATPGLITESCQVARLDCKFSFRWIGFDITTPGIGDLELRFFNAQGVKVGMLVNDDCGKEKCYLTFKAPIGELVSRVEIDNTAAGEHYGRFVLWSMDFEL